MTGRRSWFLPYRVYIFGSDGSRRVTRIWSRRTALQHAKCQSFRRDIGYTVCNGQWFKSGHHLAWAGTAVDGIQHAGLG